MQPSVVVASHRITATERQEQSVLRVQGLNTPPISAYFMVTVSITHPQGLAKTLNRRWSRVRLCNLHQRHDGL